MRPHFIAAVNETLMEGGRSMTSLKDYGEVLTSKMIRMNITGATGRRLDKT